MAGDANVPAASTISRRACTLHVARFAILDDFNVGGPPLVEDDARDKRIADDREIAPRLSAPQESRRSGFTPPPPDRHLTSAKPFLFLAVEIIRARKLQFVSRRKHDLYQRAIAVEIGDIHRPAAANCSHRLR